MVKTTFPPHVAIPYPDKHHISGSCMKCGRALSSKIHIQVKDEKKQGT